MGKEVFEVLSSGFMPKVSISGMDRLRTTFENYLRSRGNKIEVFSSGESDGSVKFFVGVNLTWMIEFMENYANNSVFQSELKDGEWIAYLNGNFSVIGYYAKQKVHNIFCAIDADICEQILKAYASNIAPKTGKTPLEQRLEEEFAKLSASLNQVFDEIEKEQRNERNESASDEILRKLKEIKRRRDLLN